MNFFLYILSNHCINYYTYKLINKMYIQLFCQVTAIVSFVSFEQVCPHVFLAKIVKIFTSEQLGKPFSGRNTK